MLEERLRTESYFTNQKSFYQQITGNQLVWNYHNESADFLCKEKGVYYEELILYLNHLYKPDFKQLRRNFQKFSSTVEVIV